MKSIKRVYKMNIYPQEEGYEILLDFCHKSKNIYNRVMYIQRHCIFDNKKLEGNYTISKELQDDKEYPDYSDMPTAQSAQQTIKQACSVWKSYLRAIKEYKKNPDKFNGKPRLPRYKEKDGFYPLTFTNQNCKLRDGFITFPKSCGNFVLQFDKKKFKGFIKLSEVKIVPKKNKLIVLITYTKSIWDVSRKKPKHTLGIDIGINNLASCVDNRGEVSFIIDGRKLKSINQEYNKNLARYTSKMEKMNKRKTSRFLYSLIENRNNRIEDYLQKATKLIINKCKENNIDTIIIGYNKGWKDNAIKSGKFNQNFNFIPFRRFIDILKYKCEEYRIRFIETEESYTSGTSFIDGEKPIKRNYDKTRRKNRGLFLSNIGKYINADINGAYQIINKILPCNYKTGYKLHGYRCTI